MIQVQTRCQDGALLFIKDDGSKALHDPEFEYNGREYYFLGGFYYDLDKDLAKFIFKC
jgi:hypothetical protein